MWAAQRYRSSSPRGFITSGGLGAMGFALPAAIGVQLARPDTTVLCISGDGGFQINIQELATVRRLALPIKMVIVDNKYLGMVRQWQELFYARNYSETDLSDNPDFVEIARAYRIHGDRVVEDAMRELPVSKATSEVIERFLQSREPELLVFDCHPEANVYPIVPSGAALSEMMFEQE
jgi:acetolactate synthase-1/2/3 large subunit